MTGRRKPDGKISKCNEVKGVALNLTRSPEKAKALLYMRDRGLFFR